MKQGQRLWTRDELILAMNLYCKTPFGRLHRANPDIIELSKLIKRTPNSVAFKLVNFASFDPTLKARGIKGAENASKLDLEIWNEFYHDWDVLPFESEKLLAKFSGTTLEYLNDIDEIELPKEGKERAQLVKVRVNQRFFRSMVLASYNFRCCITGISNPLLLVAGHISPWGKDENNRMNPNNGLALNSLHDKAYENGLITILPDYSIKLSSLLLKQKEDKAVRNFFLKYENKKISLPDKFRPAEEFMVYHNKERFKK